VDVLTVEGVELNQCVNDAGVCPCTDSSVALGLSTPCEVSNEWGTCAGIRACVEGGLTDCDAQIPAVEECNGVDEDCDGEVDEPTLLEGKYLELCDDGNDCTEDKCMGEEGCVNEMLETGACDDANPCTVADHCESGVCVGDPVECDDDNPCTDNVCTETGGCEYPAISAECDDLDPCTLGDHCVEGACQGESMPCQCDTDEECAELEDDNLCNGTLICDVSNLPHECVVKPGTEVVCEEVEGDGAFCLTGQCDPATGLCDSVPAHEGLVCDSGDACTFGDKCVEGVCGGGATVNCNDGNPCTDDSCAPETGCFHEANDAACNDGNVCTTGDLCDGGECVGGPALLCEDVDVCNGVESCDPAVGCLAGEPLECDDGNKCNGLESCDSVDGCLPGTPLSCDDGNVCNGEEACDPALGCTAGEPLACDDADACNGVETCDPVLGCQSSAAPLCDDGDVCTDDSCLPDGGCLYTPNQGECDDGNACTEGDHCGAEGCTFAGVKDCDDSDPCTSDGCDPAVGCLYSLNSAPCDDGDPCTIGDACALGECVGGQEMACDDGNDCTLDVCDPEEGCLHPPAIGGCDDGNACTEGDHCDSGECVYDGLLDCSDGDVCTDDACDPNSGCFYTNNSNPCEDGDLCTIFEQCDGGLCIPAGALDCNDGNLCTTDLCNPVAGCQHQVNSLVCTDGDACTSGDKCKAGKCVSGTPLDCEDENVCTDDSCDPDVGCVNSANAASCDDDDPCTVVDVCDNKACVGSGLLQCNDNNICTQDFCQEGVGCQYPAISPCCGNNKIEPGEQCDDGNQTPGDGCEPDCTQPDTPHVVPGFSGDVGPNLSSQGFAQCAGTASPSTMGKQWYAKCEGYQQIKFSCSSDNNNTAEYTSPAFNMAGMVLADSQCDNWPGASNTPYGADHILSVDSSNPGCNNYDVYYQMYMHFGTQWGCAGTINTDDKGGHMWAYVKYP